MSLDATHAAATAAAGFPPEVVHAIVCSPAALAQATPSDVAAVRATTSLGTSRVYLLSASGPSGAGLLDDFVQRTATPGAEAVARQIAGFFRTAHDLNQVSTALGLRDSLCLNYYPILSILWPLSYFAALLHCASAVALVAGGGPWPEFLANPYVLPCATFLAAFFITHCLFVVVRNCLFGLRVVGRLDARFWLPAAALLSAAAATAVSVASLEVPPLGLFFGAVSAVILYRFYLYARRIRAECTSLSDLQAALANPARRDHTLTAIGQFPFGPDAFPFRPSRSTSVFISYMHGSAWSCDMAARIHGWMAGQGREVFLDTSSIPSGTLWRQSLLRGTSECGWFIAVIDGDWPVTDWVAAESAYAVLLRKSVGKPRTLLIVPSDKGVQKLHSGPIGLLYRDLFQLGPGNAPGVGLLVATGGLSESQLRLAMEQVRPMGLLG